MCLWTVRIAVQAKGEECLAVFFFVVVSLSRLAMKGF